MARNPQQMKSRAEPHHGSGGRRPRETVWVVSLAVIVVLYLAVQVHPYFRMDPAHSRIELQFPLHYWLIVGHVVFGTVALVTLVLQAWPWLRRNHPSTHRWSGRLYVFVGAFPSSVFALAMFPVAFTAGSIGMAMSAVLWSATAFIGWRRAVQGRYAEHRRWMVYSFAIVWGAVIWGFAIGWGWLLFSPWTVDFTYVSEAARWVGWIVNLIVAQWWLERTAERPVDVSRPSVLTTR